MTEPIARGGLAALAIAALVLAATAEPAVGTAFVGAAIAFGLGAAFYDRVVEVSTSGVKLAERRQLRAEADRVAPDASPEQKEELVEGGAEILASKRAVGKPISPNAAVLKANQWIRTAEQAEKARQETVARFSRWLAAQGWTVSKVRKLSWEQKPDLLAKRNGQRAAIFLPLGPVWPISMLIDRMAADVSKAAPSGPGQPVIPVLVSFTSLIGDAKERAEQVGMSIYLVAAQEFRHLSGPDLRAVAND